MFSKISSRTYFLFLLLGITHGLPISAYPVDAEIASLIGKGIWTLSQPEVGQQSGWYSKSGRTLRGGELTLYEYYRENKAIFLITIKKDALISDVRPLPMHVMNFRVSGEKITFVNVDRRYELAGHCEDKNKPSKIVIGLARPEEGGEGCMHWTKKVRNAWEVDEATGKLKDIPVNGVSCYLDGYPDSCK